MKRFVALIVTIAALANCATAPPVTVGVTLSVLSYDPDSGNYAFELRNHTTVPVIYLNHYVIFHSSRDPAPEPFPIGPDGTVLMVQDTKLPAGESVILTGKCKTCVRQATYAAVLACQFNKAFTCKEYFPIWSEMPLNGA